MYMCTLDKCTVAYTCSKSEVQIKFTINTCTCNNTNVHVTASAYMY